MDPVPTIHTTQATHDHAHLDVRLGTDEDEYGEDYRLGRAVRAAVSTDTQDGTWTSARMDAAVTCARAPTCRPDPSRN